MGNYEWRDSADGTASELWAEVCGLYTVVAYIKQCVMEKIRHSLEREMAYCKELSRIVSE